MPLFSYDVLNDQGRRSSGMMVAETRDAAMEQLASRDRVVVAIRPLLLSRHNILAKLGFEPNPLGGEQLVVFTQQMAAMVRAGMAFKVAIDIMISECQEPAARSFLMEMSSDLGAGAPLTEVLEQRPHVFSRQYVAMVAAGESCGHLDRVLERLADMLKGAYHLQKKVQSAMYYPAFILGFAALVVAGLLVFAIPQFEEIFSGMGARLPLPTRFFIGLGHFLGAAWPELLAACGGVALLAPRLLRREPCRTVVDELKLRAPVAGPLFQKLAIASFARTLYVLHCSGVSVIDGLDLVARSVNNVVMEKVIAGAQRQVLEGEPITAALRRCGWFTPMSIGMMAAGEESGTLDVMLTHVADFYEEQVEVALKGLTSLLEPIIVVCVGLVVAAIVLAMILPIFRLTTMLL